MAVVTGVRGCRDGSADVQGVKVLQAMCLCRHIGGRKKQHIGGRKKKHIGGGDLEVLLAMDGHILWMTEGTK